MFVLLVDDNDVIRSLQTRILSRRGIDVAHASCCDEAIPLLEKYGPEIEFAIVDWVMSCNGGRTIEKVRKYAPQAKIILATADESVHVTNVYATLRKPYCIDELMSLLKGEK